MKTTPPSQILPMTIDLDVKPALHSMLSSHAAFWTPRHVWPSPDLKYVPYLFWLVESALPRRIVQIGIEDGVSFLSICQAVDKLRLESSCLGFYHELEEELAKGVLEIHKGFYADMSCLEPLVSDDISASLGITEIDMLVLGRTLTDGLVAELRTELLPQLNDGAVLVLLGTSGQSRNNHVAEIKRGLRDDYTFISVLDDASAPVVLIKGQPKSERLRRMSEVAARSPEQLLLRQIFMRLGQGIQDAELARQRKHALEIAQGKTNELVDTLETYEAQIASLRSEVKSRKEFEETHLEKIAMQANKLAQLTAQRDSQSAEIAALRENLTDAQEKRQAFYARSTELQAERDQLAHDLASRTDDLASLSAEYESQLAQLTAQRDSQNAEIAALSEKLAEAQEKRQALSARSTELQAERDQLAHDLASRTDDLASLSAEYEAQLAQLNAQHDSQSTEIAALRENLTEALEKRQALSAHSTELQAERDQLAHDLASRTDDLASLSAEYEAQLAQLNAQRDSQSTEIAALRDKLTEAQEKRQALSARSTELQAERDKLLATIEERYIDIAVLSADAEGRISDLEQALKTEKSQNIKLRNSSSWRYTAPLRRLKTLGIRDT